MFPCQSRPAGSLRTPPFPQHSCSLSSFPTPPPPRLNPEYFPNLPRLSLRPYLCVSHSKTVKQPPNRSWTLSVIMASVYCRFHAPPHHEPIFPHICACVCICEHTDVCDMLMMQPKCCMRTFPLWECVIRVHLFRGRDLRQTDRSIAWADHEWKGKLFPLVFNPNMSLFSGLEV